MIKGQRRLAKPQKKGGEQVADLKAIELIFDIVLKSTSVLTLFIGFQSWFFDYKFNQKMSKIEAKRQKKNRCTSHKGKQR